MGRIYSPVLIVPQSRMSAVRVHTSFEDFNEQSRAWLIEEERRMAEHLHALRVHMATARSFPHEPSEISRGHTGCLSNAERRDRLMEEESSLLKRAKEVRSQMNTCVPAYTLPAELFREIFLYISFSPPRENRLSRLLKFTHVCHFWRVIAVSCSLPWSHIDTIHPQLTSLLIGRSGTAPLHLDWDDVHPDDNMDDLDLVLRIMAPVSSRFVSVHVGVAWEQKSIMEGFIRHFGENDWENLQSLVLQSEPCRYAPLDLQFLGHKPPASLRRLELSTVIPLHWDMKAISRSLRSLDISHHSDPDASRPTISQFLDLLESCISLEELHVTHSGPEHQPHDDILHAFPQRRIRMPNLRILDVTLDPDQGEEDALPWLLSYFEIPRTTSLTLGIFGYRRNRTPFKFVEWLPASLEVREGLSSIYLAFQVYGNTYLLGFNGKIPGYLAHDVPHRLSVDLDGPSPEETFKGACLQITSGLSHITLLSLSFEASCMGAVVHPAVWIHILNGLWSLTQLELQQLPMPCRIDTPEEVRDITCALTSLLVALNQSALSEPPYPPLLTSLHLVDINPSIRNSMNVGFQGCASFRRAVKGLTPSFQIVSYDTARWYRA